ncbi:hypothetical protein AMS68_006610 [Peltaster fructicola]|uniref:Uncharacterized protein n=1 Tax=Peltaster fructicola TaxID=286661 RepID=A0A6H0Y248_9PEZI|nr:hypothetical protein AMS68_006610 [Peltaster fructicola]
MDPQSQTFTPFPQNSDAWRIQGEMTKIHQIQLEHAERLARLERRQDEDARVKSVWGSGSPFPSVLSGTPQQAPLQHPPSDHFRNFDDEANNLMSSLHLDADEEPRRIMGASSRANSVRFDESANQNHFSHLSRPSFDYLSRTSSGLGGLTMGERSASHKSDGRASSAHSVRSAASGRANSLNLDTTYAAGDSSRSSDTPALAPGLAFLGSVPAIIRCWMNMNFKHDALLYAAICTGSFRSFLSISLIHKLGFEELITTDEQGSRRVELPVYFPEAVPHPLSSRSSSPAPQLPSLTVSFHVADASSAGAEHKAIQIVLGSDVLRTHSADILFSSSSMTLFDDDRNKLSIPLVRPENAATFNTLRTMDASLDTTPPEPYLNGVAESVSAVASAPKYRAPIGINAETVPSSDSGRPASRTSERPSSRDIAAARPSLSISLRQEGNDTDHSAAAASHRSTSGSPAVWSNWRREGATPTSAVTALQSSSLDWASASKSRDTSYQRKDTGIKVLKPKSASRAVSLAGPTATTTASSPNIEGRSSRFFDEGRRKSGADGLTDADKKRTQSPAAAQVTLESHRRWERFLVAQLEWPEVISKRYKRH